VEITTEGPPEDHWAAQILELSGHSFDAETATELWPKIMQHKWHLSEKLGRDVGIKVACVDFIENMDSPGHDPANAERLRLLKELDAQMMDSSTWETISDSQPPKQIVEKRIILPIVEGELARKHGVTPPRAIIFFGPPGTGKTHFVRAMAGILQWWYIEISPSALMWDGEDRLGANLKRIMEQVRGLDKAVIFIDEFEEIAASRDQASRIDKSITNEFLKQVPLLKRQEGRVLLVCATNYIRQLDSALLRPGRFDCIIPVGALDDLTRRTIFEHYLSKTNQGEVDVDAILSAIPMFTPADIEFLFQKVSQTAFEKEYFAQENSQVTTETFLEAISHMRPTLTDEVVKQFEQDYHRYTRY